MEDLVSEMNTVHPMIKWHAMWSYTRLVSFLDMIVVLRGNAPMHTNFVHLTIIKFRRIKPNCCRVLNNTQQQKAIFVSRETIV